MKCFNHRTTDAIGTCKNCTKGICPECCVDTGNGIACKGPCESEVKAINDIINRSKTVYPRSQALSFWLGVVFFGAGFAVVLLSAQGKSSGVFSLVVGVFLMLYSRIYKGKKSGR